MKSDVKAESRKQKAEVGRASGPRTADRPVSAFTSAFCLLPSALISAFCFLLSALEVW